MESENRPKPPVITSLAGALDRISHWLAENRLDLIHDGDGLSWRLDVQVTQTPHPERPRSLIWNVTLALSAAPTGQDLVRTGTLDEVADQRLLGMLGDEPIPLKMKPLRYQANSEDEARILISQVVPNLKASLGRSPLDDVKRQLVARWVEERCRFGGGEKH